MPLDGASLSKSVRYYSEDGHLHVRVSNISKAMVCPYKGSEIPGAEQLGLDPSHIYNLLRDPDELAKAAPTFNNLQILDKHIHVTAGDPNMDRTIGSTGTDATFVAPYLKNSLVYWDEKAIARIENNDIRELSASYHYDPDMTPGEYKGVKYDGVMRNIRGNHVCNVESGRAGNDVVVMDAALTTTPSGQFTTNAAGASAGMAHHATEAVKYRADDNLSIARPHERAVSGYAAALQHYEAGNEEEGHAAHKEAAAHGAIGIQRAKKLAGDAPLTVSPVASPVVRASTPVVIPKLRAKDSKLAGDSQLEQKMKTKKVVMSQRAAMAQGIRVAQRLAMDGMGEGLSALLSALDPGDDIGPVVNPAGEQVGAPGGPDEATPVPLTDVGLGDPDGTNKEALGQDDDIEAKVRELLTGKLDDADLEMLLKLIQPDAAPAMTDEPVIDPNDADNDGDVTDDPTKDAIPPTLEKEAPVLKPAMDAAIRLASEKAVKDAVKQTTERLNAVREAERFVRPWVGEVVVAMDSADEVYKLALETQGVKVKDVHPSAYRAMLGLVPKPGDVRQQAGPRVAMDASQVKSFAERYPAAGRMRVVG